MPMQDEGEEGTVWTLLVLGVRAYKWQAQADYVTGRVVP